MKEIETPVDIKVDEFISQFVRATSLPVTDSEGNQISWRLDNKSNGETLDGTKTMEENQVISGNNLSLIRTVTAGNIIL